MKRNVIPLFVGVIVSIIAIWLVNDAVLVNTCLDSGGDFDYRSGKCLLENGATQASDLGKAMIIIYFFMGLLIALFTSFFIRKIFKIEQ